MRHFLQGFLGPRDRSHQSPQLYRARFMITSVYAVKFWQPQLWASLGPKPAKKARTLKQLMQLKNRIMICKLGHVIVKMATLSYNLVPGFPGSLLFLCYLYIRLYKRIYK